MLALLFQYESPLDMLLLKGMVNHKHPPGKQFFVNL